MTETTTPPANPHFDSAVTIAPIAQPAPVKPGWLTTEFIGSWAVKILGALLTTGVFGDGTPASRIIGAVLTVLGFLGYTASRTAIKVAATSGAMVIALLLAGPQTACSNAVQTAKTDATIAGKAALDCTKLEAPKLEVGLVQLVADVAFYAAKLAPVDWDALITAALADASDVKLCAIAEYKATKASSTPTVASAAVAARTAPDPLEMAFARVFAARHIEVLVTSSGKTFLPR